MTKQKVYSQDDSDESVEKYLGVMKLRAVCKAYPNVPERTITRLTKNNGIEPKQPGPPPIFSAEVENNLKAWVVGMQVQGSPSPGMQYSSILMKSFLQCLGSLITLVC